MIEYWKLLLAAAGTIGGGIVGGFKIYNNIDNRIIHNSEMNDSMQLQIINNKKECDDIHKKLESSITDVQERNNRELKEINDKLNIALVSLARTEGYWQGLTKKEE